MSAGETDMTSSKDRRRTDRERKAAERQARRTAGIPEPQVLDKALTDALRNCVIGGLGHRRAAPVVRTAFVLRDLLRFALSDLERRGYNRQACEAAIAARLAPIDGPPGVPPDPIPQAVAPSRIAGLKTEPGTETAPSGHTTRQKSPNGMSFPMTDGLE
jgi:hypothetical protein